MNYYTDVFKQYAVFEGRATRRQFWMFILISFLISIAISIFEGVTGLSSGQGTGLISTLYALAVIVPSLAVSARRLHDTGKSGWWQLIGLIPIIGIIVLIVFFVKESDAGANVYGPSVVDANAPASTPVASTPVPPTDQPTPPPAA